MHRVTIAARHLADEVRDRSMDQAIGHHPPPRRRFGSFSKVIEFERNADDDRLLHRTYDGIADAGGRPRHHARALQPSKGIEVGFEPRLLAVVEARSHLGHPSLHKPLKLPHHFACKALQEIGSEVMMEINPIW